MPGSWRGWGTHNHIYPGKVNKKKDTSKMHNEATCREKLVREKSRKETTDKQKDRERKRERNWKYIPLETEGAPTTWLLVKNQSLTHLRVRFGDSGTTASSLRAPPAPDITGTMLYPLEYICICVAISHWGGWIWNNIYSSSFQFQC